MLRHPLFAVATAVALLATVPACAPDLDLDLELDFECSGLFLESHAGESGRAALASACMLCGDPARLAAGSRDEVWVIVEGETDDQLIAFASDDPEVVFVRGFRRDCAGENRSAFIVELETSVPGSARISVAHGGALVDTLSIEVLAVERVEMLAGEDEDDGAPLEVSVGQTLQAYARAIATNGEELHAGSLPVWSLEGQGARFENDVERGPFVRVVVGEPGTFTLRAHVGGKEEARVVNATP